jgi:hypothetical protein
LVAHKVLQNQRSDDGACLLDLVMPISRVTNSAFETETNVCRQEDFLSAAPRAMCHHDTVLVNWAQKRTPGQKLPQASVARFWQLSGLHDVRFPYGGATCVARSALAASR